MLQIPVKRMNEKYDLALFKEGNKILTLFKNNSLVYARTKLAALYSATKSLQNSCTAKLQLFSSVLEAKQQLNSSCSEMQKRCAAFEALGSGFAAELPTFKSCEVAAVTLQFSCARSDSKTFLT